VPVAAVTAPVASKTTKPSAATRKASTAKPRVYRRQTEVTEAEQEDDDVVIIRHGSKSKELIASSDKKNGVKTISDLE
jgi:hypothetical protein